MKITSQFNFGNVTNTIIFEICRCEIPGCDEASGEYRPSWLSNAVPFEAGAPTKCARYAPYSNATSTGNCSTDDFDTSQILNCQSYVYETPEVSILHDVSTCIAMSKLIVKLSRFNFAFASSFCTIYLVSTLYILCVL